MVPSFFFWRQKKRGGDRIVKEEFFLQDNETGGRRGRGSTLQDSLFLPKLWEPTHF